MFRGRLIVGAGVALFAFIPGALSSSAAPVSDEPGPDVVVSKTGNISIVAEDKTDDGGWVEFEGTGQVAVRVSVNPSPDPGDSITTQGFHAEKKEGGYWYYGSGVMVTGQKTCVSQYSHPSRGHGASVKMAGLSDSQWANAGFLAAARVAAHTKDTCRAYYRL